MPASIPRVGSFENIDELVPREQSQFGLKGDPGQTNLLTTAGVNQLAVDGGYSGVPYNFNGPAVGMVILAEDTDGVTTAAGNTIASAAVDFVAAGVAVNDEVQLLDEGATPANSNVGVYEVTAIAVGFITVQLVGGGAPNFNANTVQRFRVLDQVPASVDLGFEKGDKIFLEDPATTGANHLQEFTLVDPATITVLETVVVDAVSYEFTVFKRLGG